MHNTILAIAAVLIGSLTANGQFNTISSSGQYGQEIKAITLHSSISKAYTTDTVSNRMPSIEKQEDVMPVKNEDTTDQKRNDKKFINRVDKSPVKTSEESISSQKESHNLPELTIPNLLAEIKKNGIKYPKIVLAQAILETGWFKSSVCRNKHNLFGLTNPRTKTYYEFNHWTESVKAYYTKVQYRYKGGNYLLWLKKIGYAEDKGYIRAIISVLKQL